VPLFPNWRWKLDRWRRKAAEFVSAPQDEARPRLCPTCGKLVGATATKCHECGSDLRFSLSAASRSLSQMLPTESPITYVFLTLNMLLFAVCLMATVQQGGGISFFGGIRGDILVRMGASYLPAILFDGEVWRLVMAMFLHGSLMHILFNSWILMDIGPKVEEVYGSARFLFLYVATGVAGFVASAMWGLYLREPRLSVGASGALLGLIGLMLAMTRRRGGAQMQMIRGQLIRWLIYIAILGLLIPRVDNAAHAGGLAAGYLLGRIVADRQPQSPGERRWAQRMGWLAAVIVIASLGAMLAGYFRSS
jgi:rhomboid protease GluP